MSAIFPFVSIDSDAPLNKRFLPYQVSWILAEDKLHAARKQAFALAEKSVRIGWTYADAFKNVRKRLKFSNRDYLFATKNYPSALEYMRVAKEFVDVFNLTRAIVSHGEDYLKVPGPGRTPRASSAGGASVLPRAGSAASRSVTEEIKIGYIKFDNGSRIIAFSAHPQAMAVYGGDVGLDEFAKPPNAELLWQTAQGRVTWGYDMAVWSSHEGGDTLFNQFAQQARLQCSSPPSVIENPKSKIENSSSPWNLYFKVTIVDAMELGLLDVINRTRDTSLTPDQFLADCRARAGLEQIFQQSYMCNPVPGGASIVDWSAIERCRSDYQIERLHLESDEINRLFGPFDPSTQEKRQSRIESFLRESFPSLLNPNRHPNLNSSSSSLIENRKSKIENFRLGFDIAASGAGDLSVIYIDEARADDLWLRALFTCRTEDWDFLKTVLFFFLEKLPRVGAAGDE